MAVTPTLIEPDSAPCLWFSQDIDSILSRSHTVVSSDAAAAAAEPLGSTFSKAHFISDASAAPMSGDDAAYTTGGRAKAQAAAATAAKWAEINAQFLANLKLSEAESRSDDALPVSPEELNAFLWETYCADDPEALAFAAAWIPPTE